MSLYRPYTTLSRVQKETRNHKSDKEEWIATCINDASRIVEAFTNRTFYFHDHSAEALTVIAPWVIDHKIHLPFPILEVYQITVSGEVVDPSTWSIVNYDLHGVLGMSEGTWGGAARKESGRSDHDEFTSPILVYGSFGYEAVDTETPSPCIPSSVVRATTLIAAALTGLNEKEVLTLAGDRETQTEYRIPSEAKMLLKRYKRNIL